MKIDPIIQELALGIKKPKKLHFQDMFMIYFGLYFAFILGHMFITIPFDVCLIIISTIVIFTILHYLILLHLTGMHYLIDIHFIQR